MTISSVKSADAFRTISEVAEVLKVPQHVLRFWETRFAQIKPLKRAGGRRFYRPEDVELLGAIRQLLYGEGYTIKGVQRILREQGPRAVATLAGQGGAPGEPRPVGEGPPPSFEPAPFEPAPVRAPDPAPEAELFEGPLPAFLRAAPERPAPAAETDPLPLDSALAEDAVSRLQAVLDEIEACRHILASASASASARD